MRKFFDSLKSGGGWGREAVSAAAGEDAPSAVVPASASHSTTAGTSADGAAVASRFAAGASMAAGTERMMSATHSAKILRIQNIVSCAAEALSVAVDVISNDSASLSGENGSGYYRLLAIVESTGDLEDLELIRNSNGEACLSTLLRYVDEDSFTDICNRHNLGLAMFNVLRLLRLFELKIGKAAIQSAVQQDAPNAIASPLVYPQLVKTERPLGRGVTSLAAERVTQVFIALCKSRNTIEVLRPSLVKIFTFPLSPLPEAALHLQHLSAKIVETICRTGLASQIVWFLHDSQLSHYIAKNLQELTTAIEKPQQGPPIQDTSLRGPAAETAGVWSLAISVVTDILSSSITSSPVLITDFDKAGGFKVLSFMIEHSTPERGMSNMNAVTKLLFDPGKPVDEPISCPIGGAIFSEILLSIVGLKRKISADDNFEKLRLIAQHLQTRHARIGPSEHVIQNLSYVLLTMYSMDPRNCIILEREYNYLPTLLVSLAAISSGDTISAVLTTLNYMCQCVDGTVTLPLLALGAASTVMLEFAINTDGSTEDDVKRSKLQLELVLSSFEAIVRSRGNYAAVLVDCSILKFLIYNPFEYLHTQLKLSQEPDPDVVSIYEKLVDLLVTLDKKSPYAAEMIRSSGIPQLVNSIVVMKNISSSLVKHFLLIVETLARADSASLQESIVSILGLLVDSGANFPKIQCLIESLRHIFLNCQNCAEVWNQINKLSNRFSILNIIDSMNGAFLIIPVDEIDQRLLDEKWQCLVAVLQLVATDILLSFPKAIKSVSWKETSAGVSSVADCELQKEFAYYFQDIAVKISKSGVFKNWKYATNCIQELMCIVTGDPQTFTITHPHAIQIILNLLCSIDISLSIVALQSLKHRIAADVFGPKLIAESGIIRSIIKKFHVIIREEDNQLGGLLLDLIHFTMKRYLLVDDFSCLLYYLVRPSILQISKNSNVFDMRGGDKPTSGCKEFSSHSLMMPWISFSENHIDMGYWKFMAPLLHTAADSKDVDISGVPLIVLGQLQSSHDTEPVAVEISLGGMSESSLPFPIAGFTFSCWIRIPHNTLMSATAQQGNVVIMSLNVSSGSGDTSCVLEIQLSVETGSAYALIRKENGSAVVTRFKTNYPLQLAAWNNFVVSYKVAKRYVGTSGSTRLIINLFVNGIMCLPINSEISEADIPMSPTTPVDIIIGRSRFELLALPVDSALNTEASSAISGNAIDLWQLGPVLLFGENISQSQIASIFIMGPTYTGSAFFAQTTPDQLISLSTFTSRQCNINSSLSVDSYMDVLGIRGLDMLVEPLAEPTQGTSSSADLPSLPLPMLAYNAIHLLTIAAENAPVGALETASLVFGVKFNTIMMNCVANEGISSIAAKVVNYTGQSPSILSDSFGGVIGSLGGPNILLPLLQFASSEEQLVNYFRLLRQTVVQNIANLKYMQRIGYKLIAFVLNLKPKNMITLAVMDEVLGLCVDKRSQDVPNATASIGASTGGGISGGSVNQQLMTTLLLVDTPALYWLILNHCIWDISRYSFAMKVLEFMWNLVRDAKHGYLNAKKLSAVGAVRWIIMLCTYAAEACHTNNTTTGEPVDFWKLDCSSDFDASNFSDGKDLFLHLSMALLLRLLCIELRRKDLDLISFTISFSFSADLASESPDWPRMIGAKDATPRPIAKATLDPTLASGSSVIRFDRNHAVTFDRSHQNINGDWIGNSYGGSLEGSSSSSPDINENQPTSSEPTIALLTPYSMLRVYLLRMLFTLYEDHSLGHRYYAKSATNNNESAGRKASPAMNNSAEMKQYHTFRNSFSAEWFLNVLDKLNDVSTRCYCFRLLAIFIQTDTLFQHEFFLKDGYRCLNAVLTSGKQELCMILPLLSLLFRIPVHILPQPIQVTAATKISQLLDLDECLGPDCSEPGNMELTLPLLSVMLQCLSNLVKKRTDIPNCSRDALVIDTILTVFNQCIQGNIQFRRLLQHRTAIEMLASALLTCSNAVSDFGSHILIDSSDGGTGHNSGTGPAGTDLAIDLQTHLRENYISYDGYLQGHADDESIPSLLRTDSASSGDLSDSSNSSNSNNTFPSPPPNPFAPEMKTYSRTSSNHSASLIKRNKRVHSTVEERSTRTKKEKVVLTAEGQALVKIIASILQGSIMEFDNDAIVSHFFLSFPTNIVSSYVYGYQGLVLEEMKRVIDFMIQRSFGSKLMGIISSVFTHLIPLARARVLDELIQLDLLRFGLEVIDKLQAHMDMSPQLQDVYQPIITDVILSCRCLTTLLAVIVVHDRFASIDTELQQHFLITIRYNLQKILQGNQFEDAVDVFAGNSAGGLGAGAAAVAAAVVGSGGGFRFHAVSRQGALDADKNVSAGAAVLEAFQVSFTAAGGGSSSANKRMATELLQICQSERLKHSQHLIPFLSNACFHFIIDNNAIVSLESSRVLALLVIHRRSLMEQLLASAIAGTGKPPISSGIRRGSIDGAPVRKMSMESVACDDSDLFHDGLLQLLPPSSYILEYDLYLAGSANDSFGEENRMSEFNLWFKDNAASFSTFFNQLDQQLKSLVPSPSETAVTIRQIQNYRTKDSNRRSTSIRPMSSMRRADLASKQCDQLSLHFKKWKINGFSLLANGVMHWKAAWDTLQAGPVWGYLPMVLEGYEYGDPVATAMHRSSDLLEPLFGFRSCHLNAAEGPERMKRKIDSDFKSIQVSAVTRNIIDGTNRPKTATVVSSSSIAASNIAINVSPDFAVGMSASGVSANHNTGSSSPLLPSSSSVPELERLTLVSAPHDVAFTAMASAESISLRASSSSLVTNHPKDMEEFLKEIAKQGVIKRVDGFADDDVNDIVAEVIGAYGLENEASGEFFPQVVTATAISFPGVTKQVPSLDVTIGTALALDEYSLNAESPATPYSEEVEQKMGASLDNLKLASLANDESSSSKSSKNSFMNSDDKPTDSVLSPPNLSYKGTVKRGAITRSAVLHEVLRGIVGAQDWSIGWMYNVQRICGLEATPALLILTPTSIHIIDGFCNHAINSNEHENRQRLKSGTNPSPSLDGTPNLGSSSKSLYKNRRCSDSIIGWYSDNLDDSILTSISDEQFSAWMVSLWKEFLGATQNEASQLSAGGNYYKVNMKNVYSVFKRRHELKYTALEIADTHGLSVLFSCGNTQECNEILYKIFACELPSSIFHKTIGMKAISQLLTRSANSIGHSSTDNTGTNVTTGNGSGGVASSGLASDGSSGLYSRLISMFLSNLTKLWQHNELSNFEYIMQLNSVAGRSFQDLTQYPVFPWILSDYSSGELDLNNPDIYRDLSKPMGALGYKRSLQFLERYRSMDDFRKGDTDNVDESQPPSFHYGTHYSCAGYVLYYLLRLQPYSNLAVSLQGGNFDKPDRLFLSLDHSWKSASSENLQDVRELIPEFFYLPEFLQNSNRYELGTTQRGERVGNVHLPQWCHNDAREFVRLHRQAFESRHVSENLHEWIDLIFGFKQRGVEAEAAMNVFIHLTYDGEVDVDAIEDPVLRIATIAQINNFGQTPKLLFHHPHPKKVVPDICRRFHDSLVQVDSAALAWHAHQSPSLCVVGATDHSICNKVSYGAAVYPGNQKGVLPVGDLRLQTRERIIGLPMGCVFMPPSMKSYVKYNFVSGTIILYNYRNTEIDKDVTVYENIHVRPITCVTFTKAGDMMATGSLDSTVKLWAVKTVPVTNSLSFDLIHTFVGHSGGVVGIDVATELSLLVSCSTDESVCVWDMRSKSLRFILPTHNERVLSVAVNTINGNIFTLSHSILRVHSINGQLLAEELFNNHPADSSAATTTTKGLVVIAPPCDDWQDGVVAVTGHEGGHVILWKLRSTVTTVPFVENHANTTAAVDQELTTADDPIYTEEIRRELYIKSSLPKTHHSDITTLKLCSPLIQSRIRDLVERSHEDNSMMELLAGDRGGNVSRWAVQRLDQLPQGDLQSLI